MRRKKFWKKIIFVAFCLLVVSLIIFKLSHLAPAKNLYPVVRVVDGDTFVVQINGKQETVRLLGADAPETVDPKKPVQCFGLEANLEARKMLLGQKVFLEADPTQGDRDQYGRLLRYVFLADGTNFDEWLIRHGFAWEETFRGESYKYQSEFEEAERLAKESGVGLWAQGACAKVVEK